MDGLDKITERIKGDAKAAALDIVREAERQVQEILEGAEKFGEEILRESRAQTKKDAATVVTRGEGLARAERRKKELTGRQNSVAAVIDRAVSLLAETPVDERVRSYTKMVKKTGATEGEIVLSERDLALAEVLVAALGPGFTVAKNAGDFAGGLVIRRGLIEDNLTYDWVVQNAKPELTQLAAQKLAENGI